MKVKNIFLVIRVIVATVLIFGQNSAPLLGEEKELPKLKEIFFERTEVSDERLSQEEMAEEELKEKLGEQVVEERIAEEELEERAIERRRSLRKERLWREEASTIEKAYAEELPIKIPRRLEQFGYDMFPERIPEYEEEEAEEEETLELEGLKETLEKTGRISLEKSILGKTKRRYSEGFIISKAVGPDYILGPGDVLKLRLWGAVEGSSDLEVDDEGKIFLLKKGPVYVWGMKFAEARDLINSCVSELYSNVHSDVTMGRIKTIQVFVLGDVKIPGAHLLTPQNTVFHALYFAGGPTKLGSLRSIKLIRENTPEIDIDLYRLLLQGDKSQDLRLVAGDVIFVPPIGDVVGIAGNVKRPAIYEMKHPLKMSELLDIGGGLTPMGYGKRIQVERVERHTKKVVVDLKFEKFSELENSASNIQLQNSDLVLVFPVIPDKENAVKISGAIRMPGIYELKPEMKVGDLIEAAEGLGRGAYLERGEIARFKNGIPEEILAFDVGALMDGEETQNIELKEFDEVTIYAEEDVVVRGEVRIDGAVYKPGAYQLSKNMKISDLLFLAGGVKPTASLENAELFKIVLGQPPQVIKIELRPIINQEKGAHDLLLQDGDHLFVREVTEWVEKKTITLSGEVKYPGVYAVRKREKLSSIIERAGSFTENAFLDGAVFIRESVKKAEEKAKEAFIRRQERVLLEEEAALTGRILYSEAERMHRLKTIEYRRELLEYLAETEVPGRLLINLAVGDGFKDTKSDMLIEDGDNLHIPQYPSSVQAVGGVYNPSSITYEQGRGIEYYLEKVGGLSEHADKNRIYIIKANGETKSRFARIRVIERGDTIVVPEKFKYTIPPGVLFKDALATMAQILTGAAMVKVIAEE